jgi:transposase-like protein
VSTRRIEGLVRTLGIERISKSRVSQMAKELDHIDEGPKVTLRHGSQRGA